MIGRKEEIKSLNLISKKKQSSFVAVVGRRRIGKTYIIDKFFKDKICFSFTGIQFGTMEDQLQNFVIKLSEYTRVPIITSPKNWQEAFFQLKLYLESLDKRSKKVIFLDELPWMATTRSKFLQSLAYLWNDFLSKEKHFILVVCGSSSSWITKKIVNDNGGLHNRLTDLITLQPFSLSETKAFLYSKGVKLNNQEISKIYMMLGGVPYYLEQIRKGESSTVAIERICFSKNGILRNEYGNLYKSLFRNYNNHEAIIEALANKPSGMTNAELSAKSKIKAGGLYNRTIEELLVTGFISDFIPFGRKKRGVRYRLIDEFSIFYHKFMKPNPKYTPNMWSQISRSQSFKIWSGYAFENLCFMHIDKIKSAMGISSMYAEVSSYKSIGNSEKDGFQIDLVLDRKDATINLFEIKYYDGNYKIDKSYAQKMLRRKQQFIEDTKTKKQVFYSFITNHGLFENEYANEYIDTEILLDDLIG